MPRSICTGCGDTFNSVHGFDSHRVGSFGEPIYRTSTTGKTKDVIGHTKPERRCLTADEMTAKGWSKNPKGWWITSKREEGSLPEDDEKGRIDAQ